MEALAAQISAGLAVNPEPADEDSVHRRAQYKNQARLADNQQTRRRQLLDKQKQERDSQLDRLRALTTEDGDRESTEEDMDTAALPGVFRYKKKKEFYQSQYSNQLMFSEWMEEPPGDLETDWLLKMCPPGKRCLVVAKRRCTRSYSAAGALLRTFPSLLPAGCRGPLGQRPTVLDCIWDQAASTFHVLDLICWNGHEVFDCETEFRFSWLLSKLAETPELGVASRRNPYRFVAIGHSPCSPAAVAGAVSAAGGAAADGALFFHAAARYRPGVTPLVLWLKPFMLPEAVGVPLTAAELGAPPDYTDRAQFVQLWEERRRAARSQHKMET